VSGEAKEKPLILVVNDDGVAAKGNIVLREALEAVGEVWTIAPAREQSTNSHSLTLHKPLRLSQVKERVYAINGTPADCTYVALFHADLLPRRPDVVVSGINHGPNLGSDIHYSGTVAAARESALKGIPSFAMSALSTKNLEACAQHAVEIVGRLLSAELDDGPAPLLNVNFPRGEIQGIRTTRLGRRTYDDTIEVRTDPRGREYMWIGGPGPRPHEEIEGSDTQAVDQGWASVTPLNLDVTYGAHFGIAAWVAGVPDEEKTG
jgi:5'-nucleotidase